jgi:hypothetical protein
MKRTFVAITLSIVLGIFLGTTAFGQDNSPKEVPKKLQELAKQAQKILDVQEIENLMARHVFQNRWSLRPGDPDFKETVARSAEGVSYGREDKYVYGDNARKALYGLDEPTFGRADALRMDILTTPLIHVAGDGAGHVVLDRVPCGGGP